MPKRPARIGPVQLQGFHLPGESAEPERERDTQGVPPPPTEPDGRPCQVCRSTSTVIFCRRRRDAMVATYLRCECGWTWAEYSPWEAKK